MKKLNGDKQAKDVWRLPAVGSWEKIHSQVLVQQALQQPFWVGNLSALIKN